MENKGWSTPVRLFLWILALIIFWTLVFVTLDTSGDPIVKIDAKFLESVAEWLAPVLEPLSKVAELGSPWQRFYLAFALSVPVLTYLFGAGPLSEHGFNAAPPYAGDDRPASGAGESPPDRGAAAADDKKGAEETPAVQPDTKPDENE